MYSAMTLSVNSEILRLIRSEREDISDFFSGLKIGIWASTKLTEMNRAVVGVGFL